VNGDERGIVQLLRAWLSDAAGLGHTRDRMVKMTPTVFVC
jgi:hypothetical protein